MFYEVIITVVVLSLLLTVVAVFRNDMDIISLSARKVNDVDKIKAQSLSPLKNGEVKGSDIIAVVRYYSNDPNTRVELRDSTGTAVIRLFVRGNYAQDELLNTVSYQSDYVYVGELVDQNTNIKTYIYRNK